jgi:hypothetical protein
MHFFNSRFIKIDKKFMLKKIKKIQHFNEAKIPKATEKK